MAKEKILQTKILNDLRSYGKHMIAFKIIQASENGVPDIFFTCRLTGAVLLEVKDPDEEPSKLQYFNIAKLNMCGCKSHWVKTWEEWVSFKHLLGLFKNAVISA